jgi:hypothetical protein
MTNPTLPHGLDRTFRSRLLMLEKTREEKLFPLQGNPTVMSGGFRSETARGQENPNGSTGLQNAKYNRGINLIPF